MTKLRSSPLAFLFPWLAPFVIKFTPTQGGVEILLYRNNRPIQNWSGATFRSFLPEPITRWIDDHHIYRGLHPYPVIQQFYQSLAAHPSPKLMIDASALTSLEEIAQPATFALVWKLNHVLEQIEGHHEGVDHYLGMGWFQKGTKIWRLKNTPSPEIYSLLDNLLLPVDKAEFLHNSLIFQLQQFLPTRADFQIVSDFAPQITVHSTRKSILTLTLECKYPHFLPTLRVFQQNEGILLAKGAIIYLLPQVLTPAMVQLLQKGPSITIQGTDIPLFISEQLPILRKHYLVNDVMANKITQFYTIVSIATLSPTTTYTHSLQNGIGSYTASDIYRYQQQILDMSRIEAAYTQKQRFVEQHGVWFEWSQASTSHVAARIRQRHARLLQRQEVMDLVPSSQDAALLNKKNVVPTAHMPGYTQSWHRKSVFEQLRYHGIPGGLIGETVNFTSMCIDTCKNLLHDNREARILWIVASNKKGSVTRAIIKSTISSYATVASLVTLRDEPTLLSRSWTLVIFQELDQLLDSQSTPQTLSQLQWNWALLSVTSEDAVNRAIMRVLHLPEQYYYQFRTRYMFTLEKVDASGDKQSAIQSQLSTVVNKPVENIVSTRSTLTSTGSPHIRRTIELDPQKIAQSQQKAPGLVSSLAPMPVTEPRREVELSHLHVDAYTPTSETFVKGAGIDVRVAALKKYWHYFDEIHTRQKTGMKSLWGLVEDFQTFDFKNRFYSQRSYNHQLYKQLLPSSLIAEIDRLWGTMMFPRWPERIVGEAFPHQLFAETFGPALHFWHGCALTSWFICEGPSSRTDLAGLATYYEKDIQTLKAMGTPISEGLMRDLQKAEKQLDPPQQLAQQITISPNAGTGLFSRTIYSTRRQGFEKLNPLISYYRKQWAERYLDRYLQKRWENALQNVAQAYARSTPPPKAQIFAKVAKETANQWYGGNISDVYRALQKEAPLEPQYVATLPTNRVAFAQAVFNALDALKSPAAMQVEKDSVSSGNEIGKLSEDPYYQLNKLAALSFWYVQLQDALGHPPTLQNFGTSKFTPWSRVLSQDVDKAWAIFSKTILSIKLAVLERKPEGSKQEHTIPNNVPELKRDWPQSAHERTGSAREKKSDPSETLSMATQTPSAALPTSKPALQLNTEAIARLREESEQLQERLLIYAEDKTQGRLPRVSLPLPVPALEPETPTNQNKIRTVLNTFPTTIDEDWKTIIQQWQPEHWDVILALHQAQSDKLSDIAQKVRRPISRLIDEINNPVDEQLGDLFIDPDTCIIASHLYKVAEDLVQWYLSSQGR